MPIRLRRTEVREGEERVELLLALVGLADHAAQRAGEWHAVMELLRAVVDGEQVTALVATHDATLLDLAGRMLELRDGEIVEP